MPQRGNFSDMKTPEGEIRETQNPLERLYPLSGSVMLQCPLGRAGGGIWGEESLGIWAQVPD